jgi:hypothetical protein
MGHQGQDRGKKRSLIGLTKHTEFDLYESCLRRGYAEGEFLVQCVVSEPDVFDLKEFSG